MRSRDTRWVFARIGPGSAVTGVDLASLFWRGAAAWVVPSCAKPRSIASAMR
jgi:hypothetical protein